MYNVDLYVFDEALQATRVKSDLFFQIILVKMASYLVLIVIA